MIDINKYITSIAYGKSIMAILVGEAPVPSGYPNTDEGILQWLLDDLDIDKFYNDPLALEVQLTLNRWILDGEPASSTRSQIIRILADNFAPHD